jgi:hypothetical protein
VKLLPYLHVMPRVDRDIEECLDFVARQPWGRPSDRELDIWLGIEKALIGPESSRVHSRRPETGIELRRCSAARFVIVYAYLPPTDRSPRGVVSIRAVRHSRVKDVSGLRPQQPLVGR